METPVKYLGQIDIPTEPKSKREQVLHSAYFQAVASTADSIIMGNGLNALRVPTLLCNGESAEPIDSPDNHEWVIDAAIAFTDQLIEKVGQKL